MGRQTSLMMRALVVLAVIGVVLGRPREHEDRLQPEELKDLYGLTDEDLEIYGGHHEVAAEGRTVANGVGSRDEGTALHPDEIEQLLGVHERNEGGHYVEPAPAFDPASRTIGSRDEGTALHPDEIKQLLGVYKRDEGGHYVEPAPAFGPVSRHIGAGLGVNVGPLGFGYSTGLGNYGVGYNGAVGFGNFQPYGSFNHYSQYYRPPQGRSPAYGLGFNAGPVGAGYSVGLGGGQLGLSGGFGFQGNYAHFGNPQHYQRYWNHGPQQVFHTSQLYG